MATFNQMQSSFEHDHAGVRWMVPFLVVMAAMIAFIFAMLGYSYS